MNAENCRFHVRRTLGSLLLVMVTATTVAAQEAQEPVFSGPQVGEKLPPLEAVGVYEDQAGQEVAVVKPDTEGPLLLVFVHELTRPSVAVVRTIMDYAATRRETGLQTAVVFLADDATDMSNWLRRARHAMPKNTEILISKEGMEGPGAYGLNRNVTLTVLVAKDRSVTANFALVQPSVQADAPKILAEVVELIGGEVPKTGAPAGRGRPSSRPRN